ncbi:MAG: hypothetical protein OXH16_21110 [Gemmatimonadetes bacterium]|nr:hypothetical protein [Gemmatimonadota bacterium]
MSLAVSAYQEPVLPIPDSPSVICTNLPVHQESLDSVQMNHTEGGWVLEACIIAVGIAAAGWFIGESIPDPEFPECPDPHITISYDIDDNEITAEIDCGDEEDGG